MSGRAFVAALSFGLLLSAPVRAQPDEPAPTEPPAEPVVEPPVPEPAPEASSIPPPAPEQKPALRPSPAPRPVIGLRIDGGYSFHRVVELPTNGAGVGLAVGGQPSTRVAIWLAAHGFLGKTVDGLEVGSGHLGGEAEAVFGRLRVGGGLGLFLVGVGRATYSQTITSWGPALLAGLRFDVARTTETALFARGAIDAGLEIHGSVYWGPTFGLGMDFDLDGNRATLQR